jgi:hypothetical protein
LEFAVAKFPDHPQLPFEGGLPETVKKNKRRRCRKSTVQPVLFPKKHSRLRRFVLGALRWAIRIVGDSAHETAVHIVKVVIVSAIGFGVADGKFDLFGRHSQKVVEKGATPAAGKWTLELQSTGSTNVRK